MPTTELGERIKQLRLARNLTLKQVGEKAKVSATHLSEIERGKTSPTIGALMRIAHALDQEPAHLVDDDDDPSVSVVRRGDRWVWSTGNGAVRRLSLPVRPHEMSLLEIDLNPGDRDVTAGLGRAGEVLVVVLQGVVEISLEERVHVLKEGDVLHFPLRDAHQVRSAGGAARILWVASPPVWM